MCYRRYCNFGENGSRGQGHVQKQHRHCLVCVMLYVVYCYLQLQNDEPHVGPPFSVPDDTVKIVVHLYSCLATVVYYFSVIMSFYRP